jgi:uncharacterized membrane protein YdjX (TVP38/TMEM64 family)
VSTPSPSAPSQGDSILSFIKRLGPASVLAAGAAVLPPLGSIVLFTYMNTVGEWLRSHEHEGIAMYIVGFSVFAGLALLPTYASAILGGWAFGFNVGFPAALCGFLGGALIAYGVCRPTAGDRVEKIIAEKPKWKAVRDALVGGSALKTLGIVTLLRVPPNSPFALTNLVLSSVKVPLWIFLLGTLVGMAPRTAVAVFIASKLQNQLASEVAEQRPWWIIAAGIVLSLVVLGVVGLIAQKALAKMTEQAGSYGNSAAAGSGSGG